MMMGFGLLFMLAILAIPILLIVGVAVWMMRQATPQNRYQPPMSNPPIVPPPVNIPPASPPRAQTADAGRVCSHCGAGLLPDWTHCPQCGAPVG
ncbi:MAG: zinc ribbon domain-containing protein [Chloroflexota bacterium]